MGAKDVVIIKKNTDAIEAAVLPKSCGVRAIARGPYWSGRSTQDKTHDSRRVACTEANCGFIEAAFSLFSFVQLWLPVRLPYVGAVLRSDLRSWLLFDQDWRSSWERWFVPTAAAHICCESRNTGNSLESYLLNAVPISWFFISPC